MKAYPIKFNPILKEKIWGGSKLKNVLNKNTSSDSVGESWEISAVKGSESRVSNGHYKGLNITELATIFKEDFIGGENYKLYGNTFPLLIKFLDANTNLSVQVHPDDQMAMKEHNSYGKTEMWYIVDHEEDAEIIVGMKDPSKGTSVLENLNKTNVYDILNSEKVNKGDSFFIPAGQVHAIGEGVVVAEVQQTSDITYRVYDWDRVDTNGNGRELHLTNAVKATKTDCNSPRIPLNQSINKSENVVSSDFFTTNTINLHTTLQKDYTNLDSFVVLMCVEGLATVTVNGSTEVVQAGDTILLPASTRRAHLFAKSAKFLEVYIGDYTNPKSLSACGKRHLAAAS